MGNPNSVEVRDGREHPFYILDNDLIAVHGPEIGVYGVAVYNVLAYYANKNDHAWPSYQTIADHLGISRAKVVTTITELIDHGIIKKESRVSASGDKTSNRYVLLSMHGQGSPQDRPPSPPHRPPSPQDRPQGSPQDRPPSPPHRPPSPQDRPQGSPQDRPPSPRGRQEQDPMNKTYSFEQDPGNKGEGAQAPNPPPSPDADVDFGSREKLTPKQAMYAAICEAVGWDYNLIEEGDRIAAAKLVTDLSKQNYTTGDIRRFMVEVWFKGWRWEKDQQRPSIKDIRKGIGALRLAVPEPVPRASPTSKVAGSLAAIDEYERIKARHGANST